MANLPTSIKNLNTLLGEQLTEGGGGGAGGFVIHLLGDSPRTADKTWGEIKEAVLNGTYIILEDRTIYGTMASAEFNEGAYYIGFNGISWNFLQGENPDDYPIEDMG